MCPNYLCPLNYFFNCMFKTISLPSDLLDNDYFKVTTVWDGKRLSYPSKNHIHVCIEGNNLLCKLGN